MMLSKHFHLDELTVSQTAARRGLDNTPPPAILAQLRETAQKMELVRTILGSKPIIVTSGYRSPAVNRAVKGSRTSAHMRGEAVDFICPGFGSPLAICRALSIQKDLPYDQIIEEGSWVHIGFAKFPRREVWTKRNGEMIRGLAA